MNEISQWFSGQLMSTCDGLLWSARQVPAERWLLPPPAVFGEWSAARHLFHMAFYEEKIALPSMRIWLGEPLPDVYLDEEKAWQELPDTGLEHLSGRFFEVRRQQIDLLPRFGQEEWQKILMTGWHLVSLYWVVSKTFQHTAEHTHDVMRLVLFWDVAQYL